MKTRTAQLTAIAAISVVAALIATPWVLAATSTASVSTTTTSSAATSTSSTAQSNYTACTGAPSFGRGMDRPSWGGPPGGLLGFQSAADLTVGQTITVTSTQGEYQVLGSPSNNGTASGTFTFTVTAKLADGYTLSITGGSFTVNGTTYTISSGTAQTGRSADVLSGQGTTTPAGQFLLQGSARGSFAGTTGSLHLDFKAGSTEYAVALTGTVQG